jgi:putative hydrolase of the HAD superfamily
MWVVRGLLLDSGDTVIGPRGGRWNPRYDFEEVLIETFPQVSLEGLADAIEVGDHFMASQAGTLAYVQYYRVILDHLGLRTSWSDEHLLAALLPARRPEEVFEVFPDALEALEQLQTKGLPVVIVSDNWSGLERAYEVLGLAGYFKGFVISEVLGCRKPDERMYRAGSDLLGMSPKECLFVDDHRPHVTAAIELGYHGRVISRPNTASAAADQVRSLTDIIELF